MPQAKKAENSKNNKNLLIGVCASILVVVIAVIVFFATRNSETINDAYFVSDNTKYVLTLPNDATSESTDEYTPVKTHMVYYYSGDDITSIKSYYEFTDEVTARAAYAEAKSDSSSNDLLKNSSVNGKYIIIVADESEYKDLKASDIKQQIELFETIKNMDTEESVE